MSSSRCWRGAGLSRRQGIAQTWHWSIHRLAGRALPARTAHRTPQPASTTLQAWGCRSGAVATPVGLTRAGSNMACLSRVVSHDLSPEGATMSTLEAAAGESPRMTSLGFDAEPYPVGTHMCFIYNDERERWWVMSKYIQSGLEDTDQVSYFVDTMSPEDRKSTRLNSSHANISYAVFCLKK